MQPVIHRSFPGLVLAFSVGSLATPSLAVSITLDDQGRCSANGLDLPAIIDTNDGKIIVTNKYSSSSNYANYSGFSEDGAGMRDGKYESASTIYGTDNNPDQWISMDLGSIKKVNRIVVAPAASSAPGGWGPQYLNGATLSRSTDGVSWTSVSTINGPPNGAPVRVSIGEKARYFRIDKARGWLGVGDFYATVKSSKGSESREIVEPKELYNFTMTLSSPTKGEVTCTGTAQIR